MTARYIRWLAEPGSEDVRLAGGKNASLGGMSLGPKSMRLLLLICALLMALSAAAERVADLYSAQVPVAGHDPESRAAAVRTALQRVLVKLSGRQRPQIPPNVLRRADDWVEEFRYLETTNPAAPLALAVRFDGTALTTSLKNEGIPLWAPDRPLLLVWAGVERGGHRRLLQTDTDAQALAALQTTAAKRGLPLLLPLNDLEDRQHLQAGDLWGAFDQRIQAASGRYRPDLVLVALARKRRSGWQVRWRLLDSGDRGRVQAKDLATALSQALDQATDRIAARYLNPPTPRTTNGPGLDLELTGITGLGDLRRFAAFLDDRQAIAHWSLEAVRDDRAWFRIQVAGGRDAFLRLPGLHNLAAPEAPAEGEVPPPDLVLRLLP